MTASAAEKLNKRGAVGAQSLGEGEKYLVIRRYPKYRAVESRWFEEIPATWDALRAKWLFSNEKDRSDESNEQLAASQKYGVIPQRKMIELNNANVMLALKGTENFKKVRRNDFVISLRSFEGGIEHSLYDGCISPAYTVLRRRSHGVEPSYFRYVLKCDPFIKALNSTSEGIRDGKNISYEEFGELILALPPAGDQGAIAKYLDRETARIDNLIAEKQNFINLLKEKRQALISHVVTKGLDPKAKMKESGIEWLGEVPEHWTVCALKRKTRVDGGYAFSSESFGDTGIPVIRIGDIDMDGTVSLVTCKRVETTGEEKFKRFEVVGGDLLMAMTGGTIGKVGLYSSDEKALLNQRVGVFRLNDGQLSRRFLWYLLNSAGYQEYIKLVAFGGAQPNVSDAGMVGYVAAIPPLDEQMAIAGYLDAQTNRISALMGEVAISIELLSEHRTALISAAVTGKIDVREQ